MPVWVQLSSVNAVELTDMNGDKDRTWCWEGISLRSRRSLADWMAVMVMYC